MAFRILFKLAVAAALVGSSSVFADSSASQAVPIITVCKEIASAISHASAVFYPGSSEYELDIFHFTNISTSPATCSVEPGSTEDVGKILQILGKNKTPFAVKGGGHIQNANFSGTTGVQIAMYRFNEVNYHPATGSVDVGPGLIWDDVYAALDPQNITVVGGRVSGVGVAGFVLGGGYSYKTNALGLAMDNVISYDIVLPNGTLITASNTSYTDLFFGLHGGYNNFGIVTRFTLKAYKQGLVWGGNIQFPNSSSFEALIQATIEYASNVTDPNAALVSSFQYQNNQSTASCLIYYNGLTPPPGIFDNLMKIPGAQLDLSTRTYTSLVRSSPINSTIGYRSNLNTITLEKYPEAMLRAVLNETEFWGPIGAKTDPNFFLSYPAEPFLPTSFSHGAPTAWPPTPRTLTLLPQDIWWGWTTGPETDAYFQEGMRQSATQLRRAAASTGQPTDLPPYPNYALFDIPVESMYEQNLPTLQKIKAKYDPENVMGLTGGFKF